MIETPMPRYEAKVWQNGTAWKAKLLRDGMAWSMDQDFETRDEAVAWATREAEEDRAAVAAEAMAERVEL